MRARTRRVQADADDRAAIASAPGERQRR
jgi:hypothetical protein